MLTLEALDVRFERELETYVLTEGVLDAPIKIKDFFKRCFLLLDDYVKGITTILSEKKKQKELSFYLQILHKYRPYFNENPVWHKYCERMCASDPKYLGELLRSISKLMYQQAKYPEMEKYVQDYMDEVVRGTKDTDIIMVTYDNLCESVKDWLEDSNNQIHEIVSSLTHISKVWAQTKAESLSQTLIANLFRMTKSACKEVVITTLYNLTSFKLYTCKMFHESISQKEKESMTNFEGLDVKTKEDMEDHAKVIGTYKFNDVTITVHELPVLTSISYNRNGTDVFIDQTFKRYPKAIQKAIIYHEIGHLANGHFGTLTTSNDTIDARRMAHQIKKYKRIVKHSAFKNDMDDDELVYILIESEADRYASKCIGKRTMDTSLKIHMRHYADIAIPEDVNHVTDMEMEMIAYNDERNRFRSALG